jgi:hypothetical protein
VNRTTATVAVEMPCDPEQAFDIFARDISTWWKRGTRYWNDAVEVRFEPAGSGTRVTVEHGGWDHVPSAGPGISAAAVVMAAGMVMPGYVWVAAGLNFPNPVPMAAPIMAIRPGEAWAAWKEWKTSWTPRFLYSRYNSG